MEHRWSDPAEQDGASGEICGLWNHEVLKHGSCVGPAASSEAEYFRLTVALDALLSTARAFVQQNAGKMVQVADFRALFSSRVQLACDRTAPDWQTAPRLLELHTCWSPDATSMVDCPPMQQVNLIFDY